MDTVVNYQFVRGLAQIADGQSVLGATRSYLYEHVPKMERLLEGASVATLPGVPATGDQIEVMVEGTDEAYLFEVVGLRYGVRADPDWSPEATPFNHRAYCYSVTAFVREVDGPTVPGSVVPLTGLAARFRQRIAGGSPT